MTGTIRDLPEYSISDGQTTIPLDFEDSESAFIVFREQLKDTIKSQGQNFADYSDALELSDPWVVRFDPAWGGPREVTFDKLENWTDCKESGIKYYSGTARYECKFPLPASLDKMERMWLDLGTVKNIAEVRLNDRELGVFWTAPWRVEITDAMKPGMNSLEIRVTNTWANRLIGDEQEPADCQWGKGEHGFGGPLKAYPDWLLKNEPRPSSGRCTFVTWNYFEHDSPLQPSGLLGPVRIQAQSPQ